MFTTPSLKFSVLFPICQIIVLHSLALPFAESGMRAPEDLLAHILLFIVSFWSMSTHAIVYKP